MAQKLMVNSTSYIIQGTITVRSGSTPGQDSGTADFTLQPNSQAMVPYGDANDPYMDALTLSAITNGSIILSDQIVITRGSSLDNEFNMNDTIYIAISNNNFTITSANTWTI